ncbi:MAG: hypothetical protein Q8P18_14845 [Pseudomonadota bacterium]|nr:hypothetical protein [Pseudomonadota bacterium]
MNGAHFHLLVNHAPLFALVFALPLLGYVALRQDLGAWRAAVFLMVVGGVSAVAALRSGEPAEEFLEARMEVSEDLVHEHEERAEVATVLAVLGGVLAPLAYWRRHRRERLAAAATLVAALAGAGAMAWTANAGGAIRHPEELGLRPAAASDGALAPAGTNGGGSDNASRK